MHASPAITNLLRLMLLALLGIGLAAGLSGCLGQSTTNPDVPDPIIPNDDEPPPDTTITPPVDSNAPTTGLYIISAGGGHNCAIKNVDGSLWCWGQNDQGQVGSNSTNNASSPKLIGSDAIWLSISTGESHSCGIQEDDSLWCWGNNSSGQLGDGSSADLKVPTQIILPEVLKLEDTWSSISLGTDHSCGIHKDDNSLWCWGDNTEGQLGDDNTPNAAAQPQQIDTNNWSSISLGNQFSCGIMNDNTLWCWGNNASSQLGHVPGNNAIPSRVNPDIDWSGVSSGGNHACAIKQDTQTLYCWGDNTYGQLGQGDTLAEPNPKEIAGNQWLWVSAGGNHTCAIQNDYTLWCWGNNSNGQLGVGNTAHQAVPKQVTHPDEKDWLYVVAGGNHTCAIDEEYVGYCWGMNEESQLGNGSFFNMGNPVNFDSSTNWLEIDSGSRHSCGLKFDPDSPTIKTLWCGGGNDYGQLGIGSTTNQSAPVQITGPSGNLEHWEYISTGHHHSCAIHDNTTDIIPLYGTSPLFCWGRNDNGQLGKGTTDGNIADNWSLANITVGLDDWIMVKAGASHTCGIKNTDELWCWGDNATGQLGDGTTTDSNTPIKVMDPLVPANHLPVIDVAVGGSIGAGHTCAIKTDNSLWCWGKNDKSQLGDGGTTDSAIPVKIDDTNIWVSVGAGKQHSCARRDNNRLYCWGSLAHGQAGTTAPTSQPQTLNNDPILESNDNFGYELGQDFSCVINQTNELWCWGEDTDGQIPDYAGAFPVTETPPDFHTSFPIQANPNTDWQELALGATHGCGIREDDIGDRRVYCWGTNAADQFGDGSLWKETPQELSLR